MCRYANELDVEFSRKAVRIIGLTAIKIETIADKCVKCLVDLIQAKVNYVVQESIVVIKVQCFRLEIKEIFYNLLHF